jgi:alpha-1,6-mannosyltransferase
MNRATLQLAWLGGILCALMLGALLLHLRGANFVSPPLRTNIFVGMLALGAAVYFLAVRLVLRGGQSRHAIWIVLAVAAVMRAAILPVPLFLSSDAYRYVWDGEVQVAGINPYRYIPDDPALASLRDQAIFPHINRANYARTIYPPAAQIIFSIVARLSPTIIFMKIVMVAFEVVAVLCMLRLLVLASLPRERVLIYAWNPLALWAFAGSGHVDAAAIGILSVALLARARRRDGLAGALLAGATLIKFLPVVVAPAFLPGARFWRPVAFGAVTVVLLYALYVSAGAHVLGFLPRYGAEEGLTNGSGFWLLAGLADLFPLPPVATAIYILSAVLGFGLLAFWIARRKLGADETDIVALCRDTAILATCATIIISPHYPWYFAWLALPCILAPLPPVIWLSAAPVLLTLDPFHERFFWPSLVYLPAIVLVLAQLWRRRFLPRAAIAASEGCP